MTLVDRTNEKIDLSLEGDVEVYDFSGLPGWNGHSIPTDVYEETDPDTIPTVKRPASLSIDADFESSRDPQDVVWFMFFANDDEPWFKLTYEEAELVYQRLGLILGKS